mgnify:CR=1 FL=1
MSILNVEHLTHGFGDRAIFNDVSFRLLKGEHIGLVGANGEGKSTFMSIVTGKMLPDEGKVEWSKNVHAGYLDQHAVLEKGMTIGQVLKSAFDPLLKKEERMNEICDKLGTADPDEMDGLMEELGTIQDELTLHDFYAIDAKVEEVARALGLLDLGLGGMIGKGKRSQAVQDAIVRNKAVYFAAVGGAGALLSKCIKRADVIAYDDLGTEAIRRLEIEDLPAIVVIDSEGNNLYETAVKEYAEE